MFIFTISVILIMFILDIALPILNYKNRTAPIPKNVSDVYDEEKYNKWLDYTMERFRLEIITKIFNTVILLLFIFLGVFNKLAEVSENIVKNSVVQTLVFLGLYILITDILGIGFSIYGTFNIEERYGFNKMTVKTFIADKIKNSLLMIVLGGGIMFLILTLYTKLGSIAIVYAWMIIMVFYLLMTVLYTRVFIKLFNKLTPLEDGELKEKTLALAKKLGYDIKNIHVMDGSKRSTKMNAFFIGWGKFKSIVIYDTLMDKCSTDEIVSIIAHEIGHSINKDVLKNILISSVTMALYMTLLGFFLTSDWLFKAFGFSEIHIGFAIILFFIIIGPIGILISFPLSKMSRTAELKADSVAAKSGYKNALISALKVLAKENFSNLTPHPLVVKLTYSHPPTSERIDALESIECK